jgi:hypothetical protein
MSDLSVYFSKENNGSYSSAPGFHTFSLASDINTQQNNVSVGADYNLTINGTILYQIDPSTLQPESRSDLYNPPKTTLTNNLDWIAGKISYVKDFFEDKNHYHIWIGTDTQKHIFLGSGCTINKLSFSDNNDDHWVQRFDYSVDITVPVTGGGTYSGPTKYLPSVTKHYISSIDENISISKNNLHDFDFEDYKLNSSDSNQYLGPEYTITRTLSAVGKTPGSGSLYYAKNAVIDLYNNSETWTNITEDLSIADIAVTQSMDEIAGSYTLTSVITAFTGTSWTLNKSYVNRYDVNITYSQELKRTITINGTMKATKLKEPAKAKESSYLPPREDTSDSRSYLTNVAYKNQGEDFEEDQGRFKKIKDLYYNEIGTKLYDTAKSYIYNNSFADDNNDNGLNETGYDNLLKQGRSQTVLKNWSGHLGQNKFYLNPTPIDYNVTFNMPEQSIDYTVTFDNSTLPTVPFARRESINYEDSYAQNLYVNHEIHHGAPVLQDLNTYGSNTRTVTYSASFPRSKYDSGKLELNKATFEYVQKIVDCFDPSWMFGSQKRIQYLTKFEQNLDRKGQYTMTKSWEW